MNLNCLVFDLKTVPDVEAGRRLYGDPGAMARLSDEDVARVMTLKRMQDAGRGDGARLHLQKIVAISVVLCAGDTFQAWPLGNEHSSEAALLQEFFDLVQQYQPSLVSWNGKAFGLPVLHYRALRHGITATGWDTPSGELYERHADLLDLLALRQPHAYAPLDEMAVLLGLPGKLGLSGDAAWEAYLAGGLARIRAGSETDVFCIYLIYLSFMLAHGQIDRATYAAECQRARDYLAATTDKPHLQAFLRAWQAP